MRIVRKRSSPAVRKYGMDFRQAQHGVIYSLLIEELYVKKKEWSVAIPTF